MCVWVSLQKRHTPLIKELRVYNNGLKNAEIFIVIVKQKRERARERIKFANYCCIWIEKLLRAIVLRASDFQLLLIQKKHGGIKVLRSKLVRIMGLKFLIKSFSTRN